MLKVLIMSAGIALLQVGCDLNDDNGRIGGEVFPDAPGGPTGSERTFQVVLSRSEEVPVCAAGGFYATGATSVTISADESLVTVGPLRITDLSSATTAAHIHAGPAGVAGPIVFDLTRGLSSPITQAFNAGNYPNPAPAGAPGTFADFIVQMKAGNSYANVHTMSCMSGEIRGQLR